MKAEHHNDELKPGQLFLNRYRIDGILGRGGMGVVYLAFDLELDREAAIKLIRRVHAARPEYALRFKREMKTLAKVEHPNIVPLLDAGETPDGLLYMVMRRIHGTTLSHVIPDGGLDLISTLYFAIKIAEAVGVAHAKGVIHRDLKPDNIIVGDGGEITVVDFGIARPIDDKLPAGRPRGDGVQTGEGRDMGTVEFMAPEQLRPIAGMSLDARADVYAIGIVIYMMLSGRNPYEVVAEDPGVDALVIMAAHVFHDPVPLPDVTDKCTEPLWSIVERCLAKNPADRCPDGKTLAVALRAAMRASNLPSAPIGQRVMEEQAETARKHLFDEQQAARASGAAKKGRAEASDANVPEDQRVTTELVWPRRGQGHTAPLHEGFEPTSPLYAPPPVRPKLGQGHTAPLPDPARMEDAEVPSRSPSVSAVRPRAGAGGELGREATVISAQAGGRAASAALPFTPAPPPSRPETAPRPWTYAAPRAAAPGSASPATTGRASESPPYHLAPIAGLGIGIVVAVVLLVLPAPRAGTVPTGGAATGGAASVSPSPSATATATATAMPTATGMPMATGASPSSTARAPSRPLQPAAPRPSAAAPHAAPKPPRSTPGDIF